MNELAQKRLIQIRKAREDILSKLDEPGVDSMGRMQVSITVRSLLQEEAEILSGASSLRGNTTQENKPLYEAVHNALSSIGKVIR